MDKTTVQVSRQDRAAALRLCELWIPLSKGQGFAETIAKHVEPL
jgi:hypothetical protein